MKSIKNNPVLRQKISKVSFSVFRYLFLISVSYIVIFQIAYIVTYALRLPKDMYDTSIVWINKHNSLENIRSAAKLMSYIPSLIITVTVQILSGLIEVFTCSVPAYGFSRFKFTGKNILFFCVLISILIPPQMIALPMCLNYAHFDIFGILKAIGGLTGGEIRPNLLETGCVFWLPSLFGAGLRSGLFIFIYMQFFKGLPKELEEAAALDGANPVKIFTGIVLPSSGVVILTVTIFSIVWHWNDYYLSVLYFSEKYPLSVKLAQLSSMMVSSNVEDNRGIRMAGCLIFILPVLILYTVVQRKFIKSIDRVGIVG